MAGASPRDMRDVRDAIDAQITARVRESVGALVGAGLMPAGEAVAFVGECLDRARERVQQDVADAQAKGVLDDSGRPTKGQNHGSTEGRRRS